MKLSFIVPVYNLENYISRTLDSILDVDFSFEYEIIVIDDGSSDNSAEIVDKYAKKFKNIRVFHIINGGVSNARNIGIQNANGEYISFVDGDDTVEPEFYSIAVNELEREHFDFVQGNYHIIEGEKIFDSQHTDVDIKIEKFSEMLQFFFCPKKKKIHNSVWGKVFRTEVVKTLSFDTTLKIAEDQKFVFEVLCRSSKVLLLKDYCINYYVRNTSSIHNYRESHANDIINVLDYCESKIPYLEIHTYINYYRIFTYLSLYIHYIKIRDKKAGKVRKQIISLYSNEVSQFMDKKVKIIIGTLKYAHFIYDLYILLKM